MIDVRGAADAARGTARTSSRGIVADRPSVAVGPADAGLALDVEQAERRRERDPDMRDLAQQRSSFSTGSAKGWRIGGPRAKGAGRDDAGPRFTSC